MSTHNFGYITDTSKLTLFKENIEMSHSHL